MTDKVQVKLVKDPEAICNECKHMYRRYNGMEWLPASCAATRMTHPVSGVERHMMLCRDKNRDGMCQDFEEHESTFLRDMGCLVLVVAFIALALWGICAAFVGAK
jgi:hypothetical protein